MNQSIRIIGGLYRGKKLHFPAIQGLRPTPDRVRETLFNWLMNDIRGARCLDAFAGSGALGFEAFSRGAIRVVLIEKEPTAYANLQKITTSFNAPNLKVIQANACTYMQQSSEQFDIIFLDPPFSQLELFECIDTLATSSLLVADGLLYVEAPVAIEVNPEIWQTLKSKKAGLVVYTLLKKRAPK